MAQPPDEAKSGPSVANLIYLVIGVLLLVAIGFFVFATLSSGDNAGLNIGGGGLTNIPTATTTSISPSGDLYIDTHGSDCPAVQQGQVPGEPARLYGCDLSNVDLSHADLSGAELSTANLAHAVLVGANLSGADLSYSNSWGVDFTDADLSGARLTDASLTGVIWSNTTCPDGSNSDNHANTCVGFGA